MTEQEETGNPADSSLKIISDLEEIQRYHLQAADQVYMDIQLAKVAGQYWSNVDTQQFNDIAAAGTAIASVNAIQRQIEEYRNDLQVQVQPGMLNALISTYGTVTNTAYYTVSQAREYDPVTMFGIVVRQTSYDQYAERWENFNGEIGKLYKQILQIERRTDSYPEKSILPDIRQTFDTLAKALVPNKDDVKIHDWWPDWETHGKDANEVSTPQLLRHAAEKYVQNEKFRTTLFENSRHTLEIHQELSRQFHKTNPIDSDKAISLIQSMLSILNLWADGLGI